MNTTIQNDKPLINMFITHFIIDTSNDKPLINLLITAKSMVL